MEKRPITMQDVANSIAASRYTDEGYGRFTKDEIEWIKGKFADPYALKLMRKIFVPGLNFTAPLGQMTDVYLSIDTSSASPEQIVVETKARNMLMRNMESQLVQLEAITRMKEETAEERKERLKRDSSK